MRAIGGGVGEFPWLTGLVSLCIMPFRNDIVPDSSTVERLTVNQ